MVDLLRHTSGLTYGFQNRSNIDAAHRELRIEAWHGNLDLDGFVRELAKLPLEFSPGEAWNYSVSTDVLGAVVQRLADKPLADVFRERIFAPLGMDDTGFDVPADKLDRLADCYQFVPGKGRTWAVLVHGAGATRAEMFRLMRTTMDLGMPSLDIAYRGDQETGGGFARLGATEWQDLETAVRYAKDHGAQDVVVLGASMGGSIAATFLERSDLAEDVKALVLDSPLLSFVPAVELAARNGEGFPVPLLGDGPVARAAIMLARARTPLDGSRSDHLDDTRWLRVPTLVMHGESDPRVPVATSQQLEKARPDDVTVDVVPDAGHVESWNADPAAYERRVRQFLEPFGA